MQAIEKALFQQLAELLTHEPQNNEKKRERYEPEEEPEVEELIEELPQPPPPIKKVTAKKKRRSNKTNADIIMRKFVGKGKPQEQVPDCFLCCSVKVCNNRIKKAQPAQTIAKVEELENAYRSVAERLDQHDEFDNRYRE